MRRLERREEKIKEEAQIETLQPQSGDIMWIRRVASAGPGRLRPRPFWSLAPPTHVGARYLYFVKLIKIHFRIEANVQLTVCTFNLSSD